MSSDVVGARLEVEGVVQGVGFRPFVFALAERLRLTGWVRNTTAGVEMEVDGSATALDHLAAALEADAPPLARIDRIRVDRRPATGFQTFEIRPSEAVADAFQPVSADVAPCEDCLRELRSPRDRRHRYPFINCTNCGPRFTIIRDLPYDRPRTTMAAFDLCPACAREYEDPSDRRFHAQPVACPSCGPHLWLEWTGAPRLERDQALQTTGQLLRQGKTVALKGLGGFHLACDALDPAAVLRLRRRKGRSDKPFALMMPDLEVIDRHCLVSDAERQLLSSKERPIVLLERRPTSTVAGAVAPGQRNLGVMLPYTPLHELLLEREAGFPEALVMTSGNRSEEPIAYRVDDARTRLRPLADAFLLHDRPIASRCDDSVVRTFDGGLMPVRRARGYAPSPILLANSPPPLLATGSELKNTFCLTRGNYAFLSQHIGDLDNFETLRAYQQAIAHYQRLFRITPSAIAFDLHPDYLATRYGQARAQAEGIPAIGVQHHHAHIASCLADNGAPLDQTAIGLSFDGTGYGTDGAIWGGEALLASAGGYQRAFHLRYVPLPGGEAAILQPWRMALAWLLEMGVEWAPDLPPVRASSEHARRVVRQALTAGINSPATSSMGRLFDAVAALIGVRQRVTYEAQAAMELEALVDPDENGAYGFWLEEPLVDPGPVIQEIVADVRAGVPAPIIAARFHNGVAHLCLEIAVHLRARHGLTRVALSGGVWQNMVLLQRTVRRLQDAGFEVLTHRLVPPNDGGLSLGQAVIAAHALDGCGEVALRPADVTAVRKPMKE